MNRENPHTPTQRSGIQNGSNILVCPPNPARTYFRFQNPSTNTYSMWVNDMGGPAAADYTCLEVQPGNAYVMCPENGFIGTAQINTIGTDGETFHAAEASN